MDTTREDTRMTDKKTTAQEVREAEARVSASRLSSAMKTVDATTGDMKVADPDRAAEVMEAAELADAVALLQDVRHRLGLVERDLTVALGKRMGKGTGSLSDGRQFTLARAADRKEWDHDDWKRDARRAVVKAHAVMGTEPETGSEVIAVVVNPITGEEQNLATVLHAAIAEAQEVHGSTAPRSRALKALGLYASDYATSVPSGWRFTTVKPHDTTDTTTEEKKADA